MTPRDVLRLVGGISIAAIMMALTRCAAAPPPPVAAMDLVAQRNSAELVCVHVSATASAFAQCVAGVQAIYCGDGGSLVSTGACSDGGAQ